MVDKQALLDEALARGVISDEQRAEIQAISKENLHDNEERLKPVGTMNEIFVTFGVALLLGAISGLLRLLINFEPVMTVCSIGVYWLVAEYFHKRKKFRLPIIYSCLSAALLVGTTTKILMLGSSGMGIDSKNMTVPLLAALSILVFGAWRFKIPFLMLPIAAIFTAIITIAVRNGYHDASLRLLLGGSGLAILMLAVRFDLKDPLRISRSSDFAFWSYVVGSPLFVHSLFITMILHTTDHGLNFLSWFMMAALAAMVSFIGLLLNRRALILSTLIYVGIIIAKFVLAIGGAGAAVPLVTLLLIGLYVTTLGSRWVAIRHFILSKIPPSPWLKYFPPYD